MVATRVEEVFKISGVPTHTFVRPSEFSRLQVSLRTPGRGVIVEGPSGIGKSTAITKALEALGIVAFAISGFIEARRKEMDLIGVFTVAFITAFGGGTLRDILLDRRPLFLFRWNHSE